MAELPPPTPTHVPPAHPPLKSNGADGIVLYILLTLGGAAMFGFAWFIANWIVNHCPGQDPPPSADRMLVGRAVLLAATLLWAVLPEFGFRHARKWGFPSTWFRVVSGGIVVLGLVAIITLSSPEVCLL